MKALISVAIVAALGFGGAWLYARQELGKQVTALTEHAKEIGAVRGGRLPTEAAVREKLEARAGELGLRVEEVRVSVGPVTEGDRNRLDPVTKMVDRQAKEHAARLLERSARAGAEEVEGRPAPLQVDLTLLEIRARVRGKKWLWSVDQPLEVRKTLYGAPRAE
jgi:hypothetical protein